MNGSISYPVARRDEGQSEVLHGVEVQDPYRWLEDPDTEETRTWVEAENELSRSYVSGDVREEVLSELKKMSEYEKLGCPFKVGDAIMFMKKDGLQNQDDLNSEPIVVLDPNKFSEDGTASLGELEPSDDGKMLAFSVSLSGSDWRSIHVLDLVSLEEISGSCDWARYTSIAWKKDGRGFYYCRYPAVDENKTAEERGTSTAEVKNQMVYFHQVGSSQEQDRLIYEDPDHPDWNFRLTTTDDGKYLLIGVTQSCAPQEKLHLIDIEQHFGYESKHVVTLIDDFEAEYHYIANDGSLFYVRTNRDAPRNQIVRIDVEKEVLPSWTSLLEEHPSDVLVHAEAVDGNKMVVIYQQDVKHVLELRHLQEGALIRPLQLPDLGCVTVNSRRRDSDFFFRFTSFVHAGSIFHVDLNGGGEPKLYRQVDVPDHDPSDYATEQVFYESKDGAKIPMFIVKKKSVRLPAPCELYGYGGFMISILPSFSLTNLIWMRRFNGIYCVANIRGGDEYGEDWHNAGIIEKKQNCFDDFQAAAEYLVSSNMTTAKQLWIFGGSNGGLLVGACINQRPELFGAAVAAVGVMDMLRFHKFGIGRFWTSDFGNPDDPEHFKSIYAYSPLHNVKDPADSGNPYPPTLLTTADHDDRVAPLHSYKYAAELQHRAGASGSQTAPLLLLVDTKAGHGAGKPTSKQLEEAADRLAFVSRATGCPLVS